MAVQDDVREREMRTLFNMVRPEEYGRGDIDAVLELEGPGVPADLEGTKVPFELKSASSGKPDISTVRDFGLHHVEKWRKLHWLFGVYDRKPGGDLTLSYCLYGSPAAMAPWFDQMAAYIGPDVAMANHVPDLIGMTELRAVLGDREEFDRDDARRLMKNQFRREQYDAASDLPGGRYSADAMLSMLRERCRYVIRRGSTLNNPHIPARFFDGWEQITRNHAVRLRQLVAAALSDA